jgi:hypothetical protein
MDCHRERPTDDRRHKRAQFDRGHVISTRAHGSKCQKSTFVDSGYQGGCFVARAVAGAKTTRSLARPPHGKMVLHAGLQLAADQIQQPVCRAVQKKVIAG